MRVTESSNSKDALIGERSLKTSRIKAWRNGFTFLGVRRRRLDGFLQSQGSGLWPKMTSPGSLLRTRFDRSIVEAHKECFGLENVEPGPGKAKGESGYEYDIEVLGYSRGDRKLVLFERRRKSRNLEPAHANDFAYRIGTTGAKQGYFVTTLGKGLSEGAKTIVEFKKIGHIQLSATATPDEYIMKYLNHFFVGVVSGFLGGASASGEVVKGNGL